MHHPQPPFNPYQGPRPAQHANPLGVDERTAASFAHLAFFVAPLLGPALLLALSPKALVFSRQTAAQALVLQVATYATAFVAPVIGSVAFWLLIATADRRDAERLAWGLQFVPLLLIFLPWMLGLWGSVSAAIAAKRGIVWRVPLLGGLAGRVAGSN